MPLWAWFAGALAAGVLIGIESWAWMRHRKSAVGLAAAGAVSLGVALVAVAFAASIAYGVASGISGWDPAGMFEEQVSSATPTTRSCDSNYNGECLDPDAYDYDCAGGSGDGPHYTGPVEVVGSDPYGLDRDGDGYACE